MSQPPNQYGYGPPPQSPGPSGFGHPGPAMPPPGVGRQPEKRRTGLIIGLVLAVVAGLGGGAAAWYFASQPPRGLEVYPTSHDRAFDPPTTTTYIIDESTDVCPMVHWDPITTFMELDEPPKPVSGDGWYECWATFHGETVYENAGPAGGFKVFVADMDDAAGAGALFDEANEWDEEVGDKLDVDGVAEYAAAFVVRDERLHEIRLNAVSGNVYISTKLGMVEDEYFDPPDHRMLLDMSADIVNNILVELQTAQ